MGAAQRPQTLRESSARDARRLARNADESAARCENALPRFGWHYNDNTFATGIEATLTHVYEVAHRTIERILFSEERAELERQRELLVRANAERRVAHYIRQQREARAPIVVSVAQQYYDCEYARRALFVKLLVPPGRDSACPEPCAR